MNSRLLSAALAATSFTLITACAHGQDAATTLSWVTEAEATPRSDELRPTDVVALNYVSDVEIAPNGKHIAYQMWVPRSLDEPGRARGQIWIVDSAGKEHPRRLTPAGRSSWSPRWSPDGKRLAFLSNRPGDDFTQVYVMPVDGGEAEVLFEAQSSVSAFAWSPDGKHIAYSSARESDLARAERDAGRDWIVDE
ncbi:MAG: PD40 domain-containing protein, partial [Myxococcales bacterium]|nr:PD40 domain-containing protein [Myxococcales bacterium]